MVVLLQWWGFWWDTELIGGTYVDMADWQYLMS